MLILPPIPRLVRTIPIHEWRASQQQLLEQHLHDIRVSVIWRPDETWEFWIHRAPDGTLFQRTLKNGKLEQETPIMI